MTDLNTAIALHKLNLRVYEDIYVNYRNETIIKKRYLFTNEFNSGTEITLPDYEHDANLYMALFEEMKSHCKRVDLGWKVDHYFCIAYDYAAVAHADTIGTAICLAFCKLKGIEVVG